MGDLKDEVLGRVDLAELIGQYVSLTPAGREFKGRCPFHDEKTPSFHVNPEKGLFHCFGCKAGGGALEFVMRVENLEYRDALEWLARRLGIDIARYAGSHSGPVGEKERLLRLNEAAAQFFRKSLQMPAGEVARDYLSRRGITERTVDEFDLGYAPREWQALTDKLLEAGAKADELTKLGLIKPRRGEGGPVGGQEGRGHYDTFRHRLVFPIRGVTGRVIGFAGRALSAEDEPKYLNVTNTPLYDKGKLLYNLDRAKGSLRDEGAVVVEGYMDVIGLAQAGVQNSVATCGTALTADHIRLLKRYAERFYLAFDGDDAGRKAAWSAGVLFLREGLDARVVALPAGVDPDELVRDRGAAAWRGLLSEAGSVVSFWLNWQRKLVPQADPVAQRKWVLQLAPLYRQIPDELTKQQFVQETASALFMGGAEVMGLLTGATWQPAPARPASSSAVQRPGGGRGRKPGPPEPIALAGEAEDKLRRQAELRQTALLQGSRPIEREVIRRLLTDAELRYAYSALGGGEWFADPLLRGVFDELNRREDPESLIHDEHFAALCAELMTSAPLLDGNEQILARHRNTYLVRRTKELESELRLAMAQGDRERETALFHLMHELKSQIQSVRGLSSEEM